MKKTLRRRNLILLALIMAIAGGLGAYNYQNSKVGVNYVTVKKKTVQQILESTGTVMATKEEGLYSRESGFLTSLEVSVGDVVEAGEVVGEVSLEALSFQKQVALSKLAAAQASYDKAKEKPDENALNIAKMALSSAKLDYEEALSNFERTQALYTQGGVSKSQLDQDRFVMENTKNKLESAKAELGMVERSVSKNTLKVLLAEVDAAKAEVNRLGGVQNNLILTAPITGVVVEKTAAKGAYLQMGAKLIQVASLSPLKIESDILNQEVADISEGQLVLVYSGDVKCGQGYVQKIYPTVFEKTSDLGIVQKRVRVEIGQLTLGKTVRIGEAVDLKYLIKEKQKALCINKDFVYETAEGYYVLVVAEGRVAKRAVQIGVEGEKDYEILKGLSENEKVISEMEKPLDVGTPATWEKSSE